MPVLGITGGIATGKSTAVQALLKRLPAEVFDADRCAHELLEADEEVAAEVHGRFGDAAFNSEGKIDRGQLRKLVFEDESRRRILESILHPKIRKRWTSLAEKKRESSDWFVADIPLLYETGAEAQLGRIVVVACSSATQCRRMRECRGLDDAMIENIIGAQLELGAKIKSADHVLWNDSTPSCLDRQAGLLARWLIQYYG